jgi:hypothetical protein
MGIVHVAIMSVCHVGSYGAFVGCDWVWKVARYVVCSPSQGIFRSIMLLASL